MTDPSQSRPYRAGLGLPSAIIIKSSPGPSHLNPTYQSTEDDTDTIRNAYNRDPPRESVWKEWNINPAQHGPPRLILPPKFVVSSTSYDELGRSTSDGVDVMVDQGRNREDGNEREKEKGRDVADWYLSLSSRSLPTSGGRKDGDAQVGPSSLTTTDVAPTIAAASSPSSFSITAPPAPAAASVSTTKKPLRVHSKDWFIRRALLHSTSSPSETPKPTRTTSIGSLLNINPAAPKRQYEPQYVLGPENKGYEILRDRLGWHGGGLGRPVGREESMDQSQSQVQTQPQIQIQDGLSSPSRRGAKGKGKEEDVVEIDDNGQPIIDLTLSESSDDDLEIEGGAKAYGPGRTAPISTTLKLDRKGLGHSHNSRNRNIESLAKKVTHSHKEIEDARRRSQYGHGRGHGKGLELGKKGKVKWKELERRDRDERRAIKAALG
ncbi:hypothetical protein I302_108199 [Kwoniella bestiolae CBS 10118]|uniref:G-patch domain-containing protein n=1 Tax=Kwoniella bestiolae CBS 10118 TaxID=1296100 RepID=A0A1B9FWD6_9TREE|nr:hypothetical protein I302_07435 [Kwoniella bestiolae CBS 10118]OCF23084.1 hypothetical protein I302_07435 [Kwoniella bestiolae CBS 10118]